VALLNNFWPLVQLLEDLQGYSVGAEAMHSKRTRSAQQVDLIVVQVIILEMLIFSQLLYYLNDRFLHLLNLLFLLLIILFIHLSPLRSRPVLNFVFLVIQPFVQVPLRLGILVSGLLFLLKHQFGWHF